MGTIKALFTSLQVGKVLDTFVEKQTDRRIEALIYQGNEFVRKARTNDTYKDRSGNLRSSIGFIVVKDGKILHSDFELSEKGEDRDTGLAVGTAFAMKNVKKGEIALIGVAGMEYAFHVEKNGRDVITGSAPTKDELIDLLQ